MTDLDWANKLNQKGKMLLLGMTTLKTRRLCAMEAAYRITGLEMVISSRAVIKIITLRPEKRMKRLNVEKYKSIQIAFIV
jgi:hypothetical protein